MIKKYSILPKAPYFHYSKNEEISIGLNQEYFPSKLKIKKCIQALEGLLDLSDGEIALYNQQVDKDKDLEEKEYTKKTPLKKEVGYIYLYESGEYYKIGRAKYPSIRRKKYITENPNPINVLLEVKVQDYKKQETELLNLFKDKKHRGEWFCLDTKDINKIRTLLTKNKTNE